MKTDIIIVGSGMAGLTAAAYAVKAGRSVLVCEKGNTCGGLVNAFERDGITYDGGIRAMENSGVLFPMLAQLGLEIEFVKNKITMGIEDQVIRIESKESLTAYQDLLIRLYPESKAEIGKITAQMQKIMHYMDVQYGIKNPAFLNIKEDGGIFVKEILPWMFKYALTVRKINALNEPVMTFLRRYTQNESLLDIISQHFFKDTPAFFALSYLTIYLDYYYPIGGTGKVVEKLETFIQSKGGTIRTNTEISLVDPINKTVTDSLGNSYQYGGLIWAADLKTLYNLLVKAEVPEARLRQTIQERYAGLQYKKGNDSVFTLYLGVNLDKSYFSNIASEHFFYTPSRIGQSAAGLPPNQTEQEATIKWLEKFFSLTTYEISIPAIRDSTLAPEGKTGLIISVLFDYQLTKSIQELGWYDEFKTFAETCIIQKLDDSIYPGIRNAILHQFSSTPLTIEGYTGNSEGAITGWSFTNQPMPAENRLPKIFSATQTPISDIYQAGQWTYSPAGLPISILTGKLAADRAIKALR